MKITSLLFAAMLVAVLVTSCSVNPSKVDDEMARTFAQNITYVKDYRTGLCFALVATRKTGDTDQNGLGMAYVPCEAVEDLLVK